MDTKTDLYDLCKKAHNLLQEYIIIHNNFYDEYMTFTNLFKRTFTNKESSLNVLFGSTRELIYKWDSLKPEVQDFHKLYFENFDKEEEEIIQRLLKYISAGQKTLGAFKDLLEFLHLKENYKTDAELRKKYTRKSFGLQAYNKKYDSYKDSRRNLIRTGENLNQLLYKLY